MLRNPVSILYCELPPFVTVWLACCEVVPHIRQHIIPRHAVPELVHASEVVLRTGVPLGGGFFIPLPRRGKISRNTFTEVIEQPELVLGTGITLLGQRAPFA